MNTTYQPSADATVTAMRALMKGRPELRDAFVERVSTLFGEMGLPVPPQVAAELVPAIASEFRSERAHVVAFED